MEDYPRHVQELIDHGHACENAAYLRIGMQAPRHNGRPMLMMIQQELPEDADEREIWFDGAKAMLKLVASKGITPERITRTIYALLLAVAPDLIAGMSQTDVAFMSHETRAAVCERVNRFYSDYLKERGFRGTRARGQKTEGAARKYAIIARGNTSRKNGKRKKIHPKPSTRTNTRS